MQNLAWHGQTVSRSIVLLSVALSALFFAQGASLIAAASLLHPRLALGSAPAHQAEAPLGSEFPDRAAILARNIFDTTVGPLWPRRRKAVDPLDPTNVDGVAQQSARCQGSLRMLGALYFADYPQWSLATFGTSVRAALYHPGELVDDKQIVQILPRAAVLRQRGGEFCSVAMFADQSAEIALQTTTTDDRANDAAELNRSITALSDTSFRIQKALVDRIVQEPARFADGVRMAPHEENGRLVGVKVYGVRRNELLGKLGVQSGDLLRSANGIDLADPSAALQAYALLRSASRLTVAVVRRGQPLTLVYDVQ